MDCELNENRLLTLEEIAALRQQFQHMVLGQGVTFFIVDPGTASRRLTATSLAKVGFEEINEFKNGEETLPAIEKCSSPHVVSFVDDALTGLSGMDYLSYMNRFRKIRPAGLLFLTGSHLTPGKVVDAQNNGVTGIFPRPLALADILLKLAEKGIKAPILNDLADANRGNN